MKRLQYELKVWSHTANKFCPHHHPLFNNKEDAMDFARKNIKISKWRVDPCYGRAPAKREEIALIPGTRQMAV